MVQVRRFVRENRRSIIAAAVLLAWDGVLFGSKLMSTLLCPVWFLVSLLRSAIHRPGWGVAVARVGFPTLILAIVRANDALQTEIAEANARRVVQACHAFDDANGKFPTTLKQLVPRYLDSVPVAKHCLGPPREFYYSSNREGHALLFWQVVPPYGRKTYNFETRKWGYMD